MDLNIISKYFVLFMMYSFAGWVVESIWVAYCEKRLVDRGFLIGPYCPIYGVGAMVIILLLRYFSFSPILLFFMTVLICGSLEYFTSWFMEKVFKARWWDYSDKKININGRVCFTNLVAFGVMGLGVTYFINPKFEALVANLQNDELTILAMIIWTIFIADLVLSTIVIYGFKKTTEQVNMQGTADNTEQITKMVRKKFSEKSLFHKRFIEAYPSIEAIKIKMQEIKTKIEDVTIDAKDKVVEKVTEAKDKVTEKVIDAKDKVTEKVIDAKDKVTEKVIDAKDKVTEKVIDAKDKVTEKVTDAKDIVKDKFNRK